MPMSFVPAFFFCCKGGMYCNTTALQFCNAKLRKATLFALTALAELDLHCVLLL